jgi:hypothetical protein
VDCFSGLCWRSLPARRFHLGFVVALATGGLACGLSVVGAADDGQGLGEADATADRRSPSADGADPVDEDAGVSDSGPSADADPDVVVDATVEADVVTPPAAACPELGDGGATLNGHCYFLIAPADQATAKQNCIAAGAHLVTIANAAEQVLAASLGPGTDRWIGLISVAPTNDPLQYSWITGEPLGYMNWKFDQPNDMIPCVAMAGSMSLWSDRNCADVSAAVCERE